MPGPLLFVIRPTSPAGCSLRRDLWPAGECGRHVGRLIASLEEREVSGLEGPRRLTNDPDIGVTVAGL